MFVKRVEGFFKTAIKGRKDIYYGEQSCNCRRVLFMKEVAYLLSKGIKWVL